MQVGTKVFIRGTVSKIEGKNLTVDLGKRKITGAPSVSGPVAAAESEGGQETTPILDFQETTPILD